VEKRPLLLGVDAGGTRTTCAVTDLAGNTLGEGAAGPANCQSVGYAAAASSVLSAIAAALAHAGAGLSEVSAGCVGMAGAGRPDDQQAMRAALEPLKGIRLLVVDDARIALMGALDGAPGVVVIASTGSIAYGLGADGAVERAGGWGWMIGDDGSAYDLGRRALQSALAAHDGIGQPTLLGERICERWQLARIEEAIPRLNRMHEHAQEEVAALAPLVTALAEAGDAAAQALLQAAARSLAQLAVAVLHRLHFAEDEAPTVVLRGGLLEGSHALRAAVGGALREAWPRAVVATPRGTPLQGAIQLARAVA
jgi:N-acetylglucosamine kinase-like BadF-type ATPase